jgi:hypothetical protein
MIVMERRHLVRLRERLTVLSERKSVLLPTSLVVFLLGVAVLYAAFAGPIPLQQVPASSSAVVLVLTLLLYTCYKTRGTWQGRRNA